MKNKVLMISTALAAVILASAGSVAVYWRPDDFEAGIIWNIAIILAPVAAMLVQIRLARERQLPLLQTLTVAAIMNVALIVGSRLGALRAADWVNVFQGHGLPELPGKTIVGGLVLMLLVYGLIKRFWRLPDGVGDVLILGLPLGAAIGRVGCLAAGCCYGIPTHSDWGIAYGAGAPAFTHAVEQGICQADSATTPLLVPVQAFFMAGNLFIFSILWYFRNKMPRPGMLALLGFGLFALQRFGLEFLRDTANYRGVFGDVWGGLSIGQWTMLLIAAGGFTMLFFSTKKQTLHPASPVAEPARLSAQMWLLAGIAVGCLALYPVITFEEAIIAGISILLPLFLISKQLWREHFKKKAMLAPASMLSVVAVLCMAQPLSKPSTAPIMANKQGMFRDSVPMLMVMPNEQKWKFWTEVNLGGASGKYSKTIRDCSGNALRTETIQTRAAGFGVTANWQNGWDKFQVSVRGAIGEAKTDDNNFFEDNHSYTSYGIQGAYSGKFIGLGLGIASTQRVYPPGVDFQGTKFTGILATGHARIGRPDLFYAEIRVHDEPAFGLAYVPPISLGAGVGLGKYTDQNYIRGGFSYVGDEWRPYVGGGIKWGNTGISSNVNLLIGEHYPIFFAGIAYKIPNRHNY